MEVRVERHNSCVGVTLLRFPVSVPPVRGRYVFATSCDKVYEPTACFPSSCV